MAGRRLEPDVCVETGHRTGAQDLYQDAMEEVWPWRDESIVYRCVTNEFCVNTATPYCLEELPFSLPFSMTRLAPRRLTELIAGRRCAREAVRLLTGANVYPGMAEDRAPVWPDGVVGSISHSANRAIAMVARSDRCRGLGIDLERFLSESEAREIESFALTLNERRRFGTTIDPFLIGLAFSAKESLFKALYPIVRHRFSFDDSELVEWTQDGAVLMRMARSLSPDFRSGREIGIRFRYFNGLLLTRALIPS